MTCIVAVTDGREVVMGGDSAATQDQQLYVLENRKIFHSGPWLLGHTTSYRLGQILRYGTELPAPPSPEEDLEGFMASHFVDAVLQALEAGGFTARPKDNAPLDGCFIAGFAGHIFVIGGELQVIRPQFPFAAVGSGSRVAYGALHSLAGRNDLPLQMRVQTALKAAQAYTASVREPFFFLSTAPVSSSSSSTVAAKPKGSTTFTPNRSSGASPP